MSTINRIAVIDAQGGGLGRQLISVIRRDMPSLHISAVGTNSTATTAMLKAGADRAATGENAVEVVCRQADVIIGPIGLVIADSMLGEITPRMSVAVAQSSAARILIPFGNCETYIAGVGELSTGKLIEDALNQLKSLL